MLEFELIGGGVVFINPTHIAMVGVAYEPPAAGIPEHMAIRKPCGSMVMVPGAQVAVMGDPEAHARDIDTAINGTLIVATSEVLRDQ